MTLGAQRDHGGNLAEAMAQYGGTADEWLDLSTGINPNSYPIPDLPAKIWSRLPETPDFEALEAQARTFWNVPQKAAVLAVPGLSSAIAQLPRLANVGTASIQEHSYNEHAAAFRAAGWSVDEKGQDAIVAVHPNNPTGHYWVKSDLNAPFCIIDESFCDPEPEQSLIELAGRSGTVVLKGLGKFWGLAGLRLGFVIGDPYVINELAAALGPWQVSGPALQIGAAALADVAWAERMRENLQLDCDRLDQLLFSQGAICLGGSALFRLYEVGDAMAAHQHLAQSKVWSRVFPYSDKWLRIGLPPAERWAQLETAF